MSQREPTTKSKGLLALGSAVVIAVYAAGYARTRSAAAAFSDESSVRRPVPTTPPLTSTPIVATPAPPVAAKAAASRPTKATAPAPVGKPVAADTAPPGAPVDSAPKKTPVTYYVPIDSSIIVPDSTPPAAPAAPPARVVYKDGKYFGYGMSRHGDIEAAVEIKDGRIAAAYISQCLTRYSCSWIAALPGQVVARQSPEVDYISGATQSTNAFYDAIVQALAKAK